MTQQVLVISATQAEAAHLPAGVELVITGVGKVAAATVTAAELARRAAAGTLADVVVVNLGTAGALRPDLTGLFTPTRVVNHDFSAQAIRDLGFPAIDELEVPGNDATVLATGDLFVSDPEVRDRLAQRADLVDMEGYAVAWACQQAGVPCYLVKHVSDSADESALDWVDAVDASARELGSWVERFIAR